MLQQTALKTGELGSPPACGSAGSVWVAWAIGGGGWAPG